MNVITLSRFAAALVSKQSITLESQICTHSRTAEYTEANWAWELARGYAVMITLQWYGHPTGKRRILYLKNKSSYELSEKVLRCINDGIW